MPAFLLPLAAGALAGGIDLATGLANRTKVSRADQSRLAELRRLEELGALGLTDEELAAMRDRRLSPIAAAQQEATMRARSLQQVADIGSGSAYAGQRAISDEADAQRQAGLRDIQAADVARASQQREEAQALQKSIEQQEEARRRETIAALTGGVEAAAQAGFGAAAGIVPGLPKSAAGKTNIAGLELDEDQAQALFRALSGYGQE